MLSSLTAARLCCDLTVFYHQDALPRPLPCPESSGAGGERKKWVGRGESRRSGWGRGRAEGVSEGHLSLLSKDGQPSGKLLKSVLIKRKKISKCLGKMKRDKDKKKKKKAQNWEA